MITKIAARCSLGISQGLGSLGIGPCCDSQSAWNKQQCWRKCTGKMAPGIITIQALLKRFLFGKFWITYLVELLFNHMQILNVLAKHHLRRCGTYIPDGSQCHPLTWPPARRLRRLMTAGPHKGWTSMWRSVSAIDIMWLRFVTMHFNNCRSHHRHHHQQHHTVATFITRWLSILQASNRNLGCPQISQYAKKLGAPQNPWVSGSRADSTPSDSEISTTSLWEGQVGEVSQIASWYVPATSQLRWDVPRHPFFAPKRWRWLAAGTLLPPLWRRQGATSAA